LERHREYFVVPDASRGSVSRRSTALFCKAGLATADFNGKRWRREIYPVVGNMILAVD